MIDRGKFKQIAVEVEKEWQMGGLSGGIYEDYAYEITKRYIASKTSNKALNLMLRPKGGLRTGVCR